MLRTQKSPEWKLGRGSALLDLDMDEGLKVVQDGPNGQEQSQGVGGPENLPSAPKRFHTLGVALRLDLDQGCTWRQFWRGPA